MVGDFVLNLIYDRTLTDVITKTKKGYYNNTDLNRVGEAVKYLAEKFTSYGYSVKVNPKTDWTEQDIPTNSDMTAYLSDIAEIRRQLTVMQSTPKTPETMQKLTHQTANDIEKILDDMAKLVESFPTVFPRTNQILNVCGLVYYPVHNPLLWSLRLKTSDGLYVNTSDNKKVYVKEV